MFLDNYNIQIVHNIFNMYAMTIILIGTICSLFLNDVNRFLGQFVMFYVVYDGIIQYNYPKLQPSTFRLYTVLLHHLCVFNICAYMFYDPYFLSYCPWFTILDLNTYILTVKRMATDKQLKYYLNNLFLASWVPMRVFYSPYISYITLMAVGERVKSPIFGMIGISSVCVLCCLNYVWTYEALTAKKLN